MFRSIKLAALMAMLLSLATAASGSTTDQAEESVGPPATSSPDTATGGGPLTFGDPGDGLGSTETNTAATSFEALAVPGGFAEETVIAGLNFPTMVRFAPDGRVFVAEKGGTLLAFDSVTDNTPKTVVDLSSDTYAWWDRGLLGFTLDQNFPGQPYIYLLYTTDIAGYGDVCPNPPGATTDGCMANGRLSRFQLDDNNDVVGARQDLLDGFWCQQYPSHSIGQVEFGPDGALYVSAGDGASFGLLDYGQGGGSSGSPTPRNPCGDPPVPVGGAQSPPTAEGGSLRSQDLRTSDDPVSFDGTILRIDPTTGAAFPGNPLVGDDNPDDDRIIAYGLRNPFRITSRPGTSEIWLGDVGSSRSEEINRIADPTSSVRNFGWPCYEGSDRYPAWDSLNVNICENLYAEGPTAHTAPHFSWAHSAPLVGCNPAGSSVSGLAFYEGGSYPDEYDGALFFADYSRQCIFVMLPGASGLPSTTNVSLFASSAPSVGLEIGPNGDLFSVDHIGGRVVRYRFASGNNPPTAVATGDPLSGPAPLQVSFDGSGSSDPDTDPLTFAWDLDGDGQYDDSTEVAPSFTYAAVGARTVGLLVNDGNGGTDSTTVLIDVVGSGGGGVGSVGLPGLVGNYISAPDNARLDITGDLDMRADVSLDDWRSNNAQLISKMGGAYQLQLNIRTGGLRLAWRNPSNVNQIRNSTVSLPVANGQRLQVRATLDINNGSNGHTVTFYYRTNTDLNLGDNSGWTQLGNPVVTAGTTSIRADNTTIALGSKPGGGANFWAGRYYQALILNGINGTVAANPDFRSTSQLTSSPPNYTQWQDTATNPWTINGSNTTYTPGGGGGGGNQLPVATILSPSPSETFFVGETINFSGQASDHEDGVLPSSSLRWELVMHHCTTPGECHPHPIQTWNGVASGSFPAPDHEYPSYLSLHLIAADSANQTGSDLRQIDPDTVDLTFQSSPAGLHLTVGGLTQAAPFTRTFIRGSATSITASTPQTLAGTTYTWQGWSDGGPVTHNITAPSTATTYVATYVGSGGGGVGSVGLPGLVGNYISAPDNARLDITGDLDMRADVSLDDWRSNNAQLISKMGGAYQLQLNIRTGGLRLAWRNPSNVNQIRNSTVSLPVANGQRLQVRATLDINNGSNGHTVTFYYRTNTDLNLGDNSGWTQLGNPVVTAGTTSIRADNTTIALGSKPGGGANFWAGRYYQALILNGINGTVAANPDFRSTSQLTSSPPNYTQWQDTATNPWTINGSNTTYTPG